MASRLTLVRKDGQPVQIPVGDALLLRGALYGPEMVSVASGSFPSLEAANSNNILLTGTSTVTGFDMGAGATPSGTTWRVTFGGSLTLTHNAANGYHLLNLSQADILTRAGDVAIFQKTGIGNEAKMLAYSRYDGTALISSGSGGASTYTWTQASALATWTISHNLNRYPSVTVVDTLGNVIVPDVSYVDSNTVQVTHGAAYAGKAYLN